ncbi:hypothetical protein BC830DRAFT_1174857 [Chytriomyces sp. MP71]|nr:hypothetical protein BC830DRAFT_1174857 [Chytriomyces sp. MP71]
MSAQASVTPLPNLDLDLSDVRMQRLSLLANPSNLTPEQQRARRFGHLLHKHQISDFMAAKLATLEALDVAFLCDDSDSMRALCMQGELKAWQRKASRWDELVHTVKTVCEISSLLDADGIDLWFANREPVKGITGMSAAIEDAFVAPPEGDYSLTRRLSEIIAAHQAKYKANPKQLIVIVATDGEAGPDLSMDLLKQILRSGRTGPCQISMTFALCTDNTEVVKMFNEFDVEFENVDVVDDYWSEQEQVHKVQGDNFEFSKGDWVCKLLLGSVDRELDVVDEEKLKVNHILAGY